MCLLMKFCLVLMVIHAVTSQDFYRKEGDCPPAPNVGVCGMTCYTDQHCQGDDKCCRTACGGTYCIQAIYRETNSLSEKPGFCPVHPSGPWVCSNRCTFDTDCRGIKKCCKNRCGAMACLKPEQ